MRDSFGSSAAQPTIMGPAADDVLPRQRSSRHAGRRNSGPGFAGRRKFGIEPLRRFPRRTVLTLMTVAAVLACCAQATVAGSNTPRASGIGYLAISVVMACCAACFRTRARMAKGVLRMRWSLMAAAALAAGIGYLPSFMQAVLNTPPQRVLQTVCFNASEALYMLAAVLFFAGVARSIVILDMLQAALFIFLRFNLVYSPVRFDHFATNHLMVGQFMALFLFLIAMVARLGAASRAEVEFLCALSWFFGLRLIQFFLSNQVSYIWLHYTYCSLWDVPGSVLLAGFALCLAFTSRRERRQLAECPAHAPGVMVSSLMPSFLTLVNVMLGLFLLRVSVTLAAVAMALSLVCYVVRTVLLQAAAIRDKADLQTRNEHLEELAVRDPLTGIGNRRSLAEVYSRLQSAAGSQSLSLLLIDVDQFKQANDRHGHLHGDRLLIALAGRLEKLVAGVSHSHCARMGGDEFALLLPRVVPQTAFMLAEELRALFAAHRFQAGAGRVSLSIGVASVQAARELPLETLVRMADEALYRAKQLGRDRVEMQPVWNPETAACAAVPGARLELQHSTG
jgi:diguanylate cyclase (GGDEF)-like protein